MKDTHIFDLIQEPGYEHTEQNLGELLKDFTSAFVSLGGNTAAAFNEWSHLNRMFARGAVLRTLLLEEAFSRAFLHFKDNLRTITSTFCFWRLLCKLLPWRSFWQSLVCRSVCLLSSERRQVAEGPMLLFLVVHAWLTTRKHDPALISTVSLVDKWIEMSG